MLTFAPVAEAQTVLCQAVANHVWSKVAAAPLAAQTPLAELTEAVPASFKPGETGLARPGQPVADALVQDHAADAALARKLRDFPQGEAMRLGQSRVWVLDGVESRLGCHSVMTVVVPPGGGAAHEIALPGALDPSSLCGLSALSAVSIDGTPALWIEQSGAFANAPEQSTISIAGLRGEAFAPPCTVTVSYDIADRAAHAFCDGVDCVPLLRRAELLAMRLRQGETADSLGAGVVLSEGDDVDYRRMTEMLAVDKNPVSLPTFGVSLPDMIYGTFADPVVFPMRLDDGAVYLARLGHGTATLGMLEPARTADTLLALYRLRDEKVAPAASVYVSAKRTGISGVEVN